MSSIFADHADTSKLGDRLILSGSLSVSGCVAGAILCNPQRSEEIWGNLKESEGISNNLEDLSQTKFKLEFVFY